MSSVSDGVRPERVLSPTRDFDLDLYENRIASRLVDHLWRFLNQRIAEVRQMDAMVEDVKRIVDDIAHRPWWAHGHLFDLLTGFAVDDTWHTRMMERLAELERLSHGVTSLLGSPVRRGVKRRSGQPVRYTRIACSARDEK
ncbi:hypothetical protein [Micromonospora sp. CPCC 206061]|uniref:hypothetical protein n=1 Tax=Micromonospora sp. CPCC 206061 TaxID=3122410 RepID=UPI002FF16205